MFAEIAFYPEQASTTANQVDLLFYFLTGVCGAVGLLVAVLIIYFCIRYRRRPGQVGPPPPTQQALALEWFWTLSPIGIFMVMFTWGATIYFDAYRAPDDATPIYVQAKQWMWKFQHPEGQREINELHVPTGRPFKLLLTSEDVIHSFFVPALRLKQDAVPGQAIVLLVHATKPGNYDIACAQLCGMGHYQMNAKLKVVPQAEYQAWLLRSAPAMAKR